MKYLVNDIYSTIQGEGCLCGTAMVLLRLQGCDVGCPWCDTKETWETNEQYKKDDITTALGSSPYYTEMVPTEILHHIKTYHKGPKWVLITGGEPALQDLTLLNQTLGQHYKIALETSGTATGHLNSNSDWVCVSPKIDMPGGRVVLPVVLSNADELKFVIGKSTDLNKVSRLLESTRLKNDVQICLQPISQSTKATDLCVQAVQKNGWRLSIQIHKYLGLQ